MKETVIDLQTGIAVERELTSEEITATEARREAGKQEPPKPLSDQLNQDFKSLPAEARAQFFVHKAAVKLALEEGDKEAAKLLISGVAVPDELKPVKDKMLEKFK